MASRYRPSAAPPVAQQRAPRAPRCRSAHSASLPLRVLAQPRQGARGELAVPGPARGLDQLAERPHRDEQLRRVVARLDGRPERLLVAAEAVHDDRVGPVRVLDGGSLAAARWRPVMVAVDQRRRPRTRGRGAPRAPARRTAPTRVPVASLTASASRDQQRGRREVAAQGDGLAEHVDADGEHLERPRVAGELRRRGWRPRGTCRNPTRRRPPPSRASPSGAPPRRRPRSPANALTARLTTGAAAGRPSVKTVREAVEQQIARARRVRGPRGRPRRPGRRRAGRRRSPAARRTAPRPRHRDRCRARAARRAARASSPPGAAAVERRRRGSARRRSRPAAGPPGPARARPAVRPRRLASSPSAVSNAPACRLACAAASVRSARRSGSIVRVGGPPEERRRGGKPAPGLRPACRALELAATSSSGPRVACARCQARRSGSSAPSVASASAPCTRRRSRSEADR